MTQPDWHPADIIAGLRKKGTSLAEVSRRAGLASSTLANALETSPEIILPSGYIDDRGNRTGRLMQKRRS
ncbi:helix-turn-helix domain-containing protein [Escherichia coli]|nr:transcriptional regulator [Escherichia coli]EFD0641608.1 transcriptional regulator [Escherichia coli]EFH5998056.1 transcriptional regulator [Escherichia coli]EFH8644539.1 transcriptional regulator [Escherichia coli]EHW5879997.1 helix-turn-helix domain-containing protein [Escherichia coli]